MYTFDLIEIEKSYFRNKTGIKLYAFHHEKQNYPEFQLHQLFVKPTIVLEKMNERFNLSFQYLYEFGWHTKGLIGITQPRRVSALTLADRVASERGEILGDTVGVSVSFIDKYSEHTYIKVMIRLRRQTENGNSKK